jgi:hypothetical protein
MEFVAGEGDRVANLIPDIRILLGNSWFISHNPSLLVTIAKTRKIATRYKENENNSSPPPPVLILRMPTPGDGRVSSSCGRSRGVLRLDPVWAHVLVIGLHQSLGPRVAGDEAHVITLLRLGCRVADTTSQNKAPSFFSFLKEGFLLPSRNGRLFTAVCALITGRKRAFSPGLQQPLIPVVESGLDRRD